MERAVAGNRSYLLVLGTGRGGGEYLVHVEVR